VWNYTPVESTPSVNNIGKRNGELPHFNRFFVHFKYTSNMAAYYEMTSLSSLRLMYKLGWINITALYLLEVR